jgi:hypothetical protein
MKLSAAVQQRRQLAPTAASRKTGPGSTSNP